ncbi:MAG: sterol desaturase family protein [bacterium]|nr:sterol desaturase family protein [bacterium]
MNIFQKIASRLGYPFTMVLSLYLHFYLVQTGIVPYLSAVIAILFGGLLVTLLEAYLPYRVAWRENLSDFANDAAYMVFVQVALPRLFAFLVTITLLNYLDAAGLTLGFLWPHNLPIYVQAIIMLLIADFLRYWFHRANHRYVFLWKLHMVHHSPKKLYWINTGRFHPVEKIIQLCADTVPFLILGVPAEVLAIYFTFYSVNGFFQHCNINLELGFLKYIVSGPQLHHWHHSIHPNEGNKNLGSNLIIWDIIFGTWYLPSDREVGELGILDADYPLDFWRQQSAPFTHRH